MAIKYPTKFFLGANLINPKVYYKTIKALIDAINNGTTRTRTASAINATATATPAQIATGYITSTSAAATAITLPSAQAMAAQLGVTAGGAWFDFEVDNSAGANTVTIVVGSGITTITPPITGGNTLTVSTANAVGFFRLTFTSTTTAKLIRMA